MGEWSDSFFERRTERSRGKFIDEQGRTLDRTKKLDQRKQQYQEFTTDRYAEALEGTAEMNEEGFGYHVDSVIDTMQQSDAAAGEDMVLATDFQRRELKRRLNDVRYRYRQLKQVAIAATARIEGIASRGGGYAAPVVQGRAGTTGPVVLAVLVAVLEMVPTALFIEDNQASLFATVSGIMYDLIPWLAAALATSVTMAITFWAGRTLKQGVKARQAAKAQNASSGQGGEMTGGILFALIAAALQTVMLGMRFSTESGDDGAQGLLTILALLSFIGAFAVFLWEYNAYTPSGSVAAVNTLQVDEAAVAEFELAERTMNVDIPTELRDLELRSARYTEEALKALSPAARKISPMHLKVILEKLAEVRRCIAELVAMDFDYEPFDRFQAAYERYRADPAAAQPRRLDDELSQLLRTR
jgi:hypothetical protein